MVEIDHRIDTSSFDVLIPHTSTCIAVDTVTVERQPVGYMRRDQPMRDYDSGWQFLTGFETQEYLDDLSNSAVYNLNSLANLDPAIIPYLDAPVGAQLWRVAGTDEFSPYSFKPADPS